MSDIAFFGLLLALLVFAVLIFNRLVADRNLVLSAWSDIDVQLKRRHDLVPRLVKIVKAYAAHEKATLEAVTELRSRSVQAARLTDKAGIEEKLEQAMHELVVVGEAYPDLKADESFRQLQTELTEVEDFIQYARRFYNGAVRIFNTRVQTFPHLLIARPFGFASAEYFEVEHQQEREAPKISIGSN